MTLYGYTTKSFEDMPPTHPNCRCSFCLGDERTEYNDLGSKLAAQILLAGSDRRVIVHLLERDDELKRRRS